MVRSNHPRLGRFLLVACLLVAAGVLAGVTGSQLLHSPVPQSTELAVERRLMCPQCTELRLDVCDRQICQDMRADIRRRLAEGQTPDDIVRGYYRVYGAKVLAEESDRLALDTWWLPQVAVGLGLLCLVLVALRRTGHLRTLTRTVRRSRPLDDG